MRVVGTAVSGTAGRFFGCSLWVGTLGVLTRVWRVEVEGRRGGVFGSTAHRSNVRTRPATERKRRVGEGRDGQRRASSGRSTGATRARPAVLHRAGSDPGRRAGRRAGRARGRRTVRVCSPSRPPLARRRSIESPVENLPARAHRRRRVTPATKPRRPKRRNGETSTQRQ